MPPGAGETSVNYRELLSCLNRSARLIRMYLGNERGVVVSLVLQHSASAKYCCGLRKPSESQPLDPLLSEAALFELVRKAQSRVIFVPGPQDGSDLWQKVQAVAGRLPHPAEVFSVGAPDPEIDRHYDHAITAFDDGDLPEDWLPRGDADVGRAKDLIIRSGHTRSRASGKVASWSMRVSIRAPTTHNALRDLCEELSGMLKLSIEFKEITALEIPCPGLNAA